MFCDAFYCSINKSKEELCGDSVEVIRGDDCTIIVLADGLGSGVKANILSTMTAKIISTLLKENLNIEEVVSTLFKTLPVCKVRNLAYSTFTIVRIDKTGQAYLLEFDNPGAILIRNKRHSVIDFTRRAIEGYNIKEAYINLLPSDELYIFSDGIVHAGIGASLNLGWQRENIASFIEKIQKESEVSIFEKVLHVLNTCNKFYNGQPGDDSSIVGVEAKNQKQGVVMIGPPIDKSRDGEVVRLLMQKDALKAVCGGTAANIVAREINEKIKPRLDFPDPSVPPIAEIKGIDLVTEGVVTLSKTFEIMKSITADNPIVPEFSRKKDGASRLAKFILKDCTHIKFLVGMTLNPAHKEFEFHNSMIKHRIVDDLVGKVRQLGKNVSVQYY